MITAVEPRHTRHASSGHGPPDVVRATLLALALTLALAVIVVAFGLPASRTAPHDVPIGVAGPQAAGGPIAPMLEQQAPGAFAITFYPGEEALRDAIRNRDVYGGIAFGPEGRSLLIATGGSPMVAQMLTQIGNGIAQKAGVPLVTEDLAPPTAADPRGAGLAASALPITLAGLLPAYAFVLIFNRQVWLRLAGTAAVGLLGALSIALLLWYVFESIDQNFWGVAGGLALGALAMGLSVLGLGSVFGKAGLAVGALLAILLGNPLSGLNSAPELLPRGWGQLGQWLPQGANATLLRSTAFFDGAGGTVPVIVLACWALAGVVLVAIAAARQYRVDQPTAR